MPLVRKPVGAAADAGRDAAAVLAALASGTDDERWAAARAAAELPGGVAALGRGAARRERVRACARRCSRPGAHRARRRASSAVLPFLRSDDASSAHGRLDALRAMHERGSAAHLPRLLARPRCRRPRARAASSSREHARATRPTRCSATCSTREPEQNVCAAAVDVLAEIGGARGAAGAGALRGALSRQRRSSAFAIKVATDRIGSQSPSRVPDFAALTEEEFRRLCDFLYRRTGMVFTEAKRYYVERRVVERMTATGSRSFDDYFARLRGDVRRRDRAVRQRVHRQRDLLLPRGAPARAA